MAIYTVSTTADEAFGGGDLASETADGGGLSLREAIAFANSDADASTITFASDIGDAFENDALIRLTQGELVITQALTIDGSSAGGGVVITGDANGDDITLTGTEITDVSASFGGTAGAMDDLLDDNSRVFNITSGTTTLDSLTITGGRTTADNQRGGAIYSAGTTILTNSTVSGNSTSGFRSDGGGIYTSRTVTLTNSTVSGNSTSGDFAEGGGIFVTFTMGTILTNSTVSGNSTSGFRSDGGGHSYRFCDADQFHPQWQFNQR